MTGDHSTVGLSSDCHRWNSYRTVHDCRSVSRSTADSVHLAANTRNTACWPNREGRPNGYSFVRLPPFALRYVLRLRAQEDTLPDTTVNLENDYQWTRLQNGSETELRLPFF